MGFSQFKKKSPKILNIQIDDKKKIYAIKDSWKSLTKKVALILKVVYQKKKK